METKTKIRVVLGAIILIADLLWLSGSFTAFGSSRLAVPYGNFTPGNYTHFNYTQRGTYARFGIGRYLDVTYGVVILVADLIWLFLELKTKEPTKIPAQKKK